MRPRLIAICVMSVMVTSLGSLTATSAAHAYEDAGEGIALAQQPEGDPEAEGQEGQDQGDGEGQSDEAAETGASEGETEDGTSEGETGPPWTYQMARITLALLLGLVLALAYLYYRLVASRRRGAV